MEYKREMKDTVWLVVLQGVTYLVPVLVWPYLMVVLGAGGFGEFSFSLSMAQYLMLMVDFGFNLSATKRIAIAKNEGAELNRIFTATMAAKGLLLLGAGIVMVALCGVPQFAPYRGTMGIFFLMVVANTGSMFFLFQGIGKVRYVSIINGATKVLILPFTFLWVKTADDIAIAAWLQVGVFVMSALITNMLLWKNRYARWVSVRWADIWGEMKAGVPIFLSQAASSIYISLFVVILALFVPSDEVGRYAAGEKLMRCCCYLIWVPISQAFFPRISSMGAENREKARQLIDKMAGVIVGVMVIVGCGIFFFAEPVCALVGKGYEGLQTIARVLAFLPIAISLGGLWGQMGLIALGDERDRKHFMNVYLVAAVVAIVAVLVGASWGGAIGTAWALVVTEGTVAIGMGYYYRTHYKTRL